MGKRYRKMAKKADGKIREIRDGQVVLEVPMKTKTFFPMCLVVLYLMVSFSSFAQENKEPKKALDARKSLDAFITATTKAAPASSGESGPSKPVPGAEITVEQVPIKSVGVKDSGPAEKTQFDVILKSKLTTNDKGEFTLNITQEQFKKLPEEFRLKFTIKPKEKDKYPVENNSFILKVKKSDGPKFKFVVVYLPSTLKSNKGCFAVNAKTQN